MELDQEEKNILSAYESCQMKLSTPTEEEIEAIKATANNTMYGARLWKK